MATMTKMHSDLTSRSVRIAATCAVLLWSGASGARCEYPEPFAYGLFGSAAEYASGPNFLLDDEGVLAHDYGAAYGGLGVYRNPFFVSRYAHALYRDYYETGCSSEELRARFLTQVRWFRENHERVDEMAYWRYGFVNDRFDLPAGWISGIGQSHIAGVLLRAAIMTNDEELAELAQRAVAVYLRPVSEGGVVTEAAVGSWLQEYPAATTTSTYVLNGHITGLLGLIDVSGLGDFPALARVVREAIDAVRHTIRDFDAGFTSFYSLVGVRGEPPIPTPVHGYNSLHITQLLALYDLDGDPLFLEMALRLQAYTAIEYRRDAAGATDPEFGPARADGESGLRYWSHNEFPTWYAVDFEAPRALLGVFVRGRDPTSAPRDFAISVATPEGWRRVWSTAGNGELALFARFDAPITTHAYRLDIDSDNGNRNVAIHMTYPVFTDGGFSPVANYYNHRYRADTGQWTVDAALDGGRITTHGDGFIVFPRLTGAVRVGSIGAPSGTLRVASSDDLASWSPVGTITPHSRGVFVPEGQFVRLDFSADVEWIGDIRVERHQAPAVGATRSTAGALGWAVPSRHLAPTPEVVRREALGSTSPATHGPEHAAAQRKYWSHNEFPTWYQVGFAEHVPLAGVAIVGRTSSSTPRELDLSVATPDGWSIVWSTRDNEQQELTVSFDEPILTTAFRLDIHRDNGNGNVALELVVPVVEVARSASERLLPGIVGR
jgi:hypothetical protein